MGMHTSHGVHQQGDYTCIAELNSEPHTKKTIHVHFVCTMYNRLKRKWQCSYIMHIEKYTYKHAYNHVFHNSYAWTTFFSLKIVHGKLCISVKINSAKKNSMMYMYNEVVSMQTGGLHGMNRQ